MKKHNKTFLSNDPNETGEICWRISYDGKEGSYEYLEADLIFGDCRRKVELDFHCYDRKELLARIDKVDVLIEELNKFKNHLVNIHQKNAQKIYKRKYLL